MNPGGGRRRPAGAALVLVVLVVTSTACSAGKPEVSASPSASPVYSADRICAGLFPGEGGKALERVLGSTQFKVRDEEDNPDVQAAAQQLEDAYRAGAAIRDMSHPRCEVAAQPGKPHVRRLIVDFVPLSRHIQKSEDFLGPDDKGVRVSAGVKHVSLGFDCVSSRAASTEEIPLRISVQLTEQGTRKGDAVLAQDYRAITHGAALAVAEELGCVNDGGLPARAAGLPERDAG
ncbi:hypothetical protein [Streptomyces xanthophaeus]|uniref:hypothetical protein n=1 Tax=Streptomyces xanthophaeus TaxID=67385 RepID=UPI0004CD346E|nr:hypothetical protein [Streptomyces xanthophaeus]